MSSLFSRSSWHDLVRPLWLGAAVICLGAAFALPAAEAAMVDPLPHRALYHMQILKSGGDIADVEGEMAFEWQDSCDGWSVTQRSQMDFLYASGDAARVGWSLTSWESKDGTRYRFVSRELSNGQVVSEYRGDADLSKNGGEARYNKPEPHHTHLPAGSLFPTQHSLALIEQALKGTPMLWAEVFDGSDADGLFAVSAAISPLPESARKAADQHRELKGVPGWHVSLAFYAPQGQAAEPEHEQSLQLYANGVVDRLVLDYGEFSILGTLSKIETLPKPNC
jgi:envelope integrity protein B